MLFDKPVEVNSFRSFEEEDLELWIWHKYEKLSVDKKLSDKSIQYQMARFISTHCSNLVFFISKPKIEGKILRFQLGIK